jgi:hypothetical protein
VVGSLPLAVSRPRSSSDGGARHKGKRGGGFTITRQWCQVRWGIGKLPEGDEEAAGNNERFKSELEEAAGNNERFKSELEATGHVAPMSQHNALTP